MHTQKKSRRGQQMSRLCSCSKWAVCFAILFQGLFVWVGSPEAANYYVSPTGNDANSGSISAPWATPQKAWYTAQAGDTVYFRGGTYTITSSFSTQTNGYDGTEANPITFTNYPGETATLTSQVHDYLVKIEKNWNIVRGLNLISYETFFFLSYNTSVNGFIAENNTYQMTNGADNAAFVHVSGWSSGTPMATNVTIRNNILRGPRAIATSGVIAFNAQSLKVLNNEIYDFYKGVHFKHGNYTNASSSIEIAYNYIHDTITEGIFLNSNYANIHDNLLVDSDISLNDDNGGSGGNYNTIINNTFIGRSIGIKDNLGNGKYNIIKNNVNTVKAKYYYECTTPNHYSFLDYNLYPTGAVVAEDYTDYAMSNWRLHHKANAGTGHGTDEDHSISGSAIFVGGSNPTTISGFGLAVGSPGKSAAADGKDLGANVALVGPSITIVADSQAPTTPTGLAASAVSSTSISLTWGAATDNVAVMGYRIYRGGASIGTSVTTSYTDTGLSAATAYTYAVSAYDAAGNTSALSTSASATTLAAVADSQAPTTPTGLAASAVSSTSISLTWGAATDNVAVTGYRIYRGGVSIGTSTTTGHTDAGLSAATAYTYAVSAYDAAGNTSALSTSASATTLTASLPGWGCGSWQTEHPEWIFCDDFDNTNPLIASGRYFDYDNDGGIFIPMAGVGYGESKGMRALWHAGDVSAGGIQVTFGRNPMSSNGIKTSQDFRDVYYRMYLKQQSGWQGNPVKLSRAVVFSASNWSQAAIGHVWGNDATHLAIDPAACVSGGSVQCVGYNDFTHLSWLGAQNGTTPLFDGNHNDKWYCIEAHMKLNDSGSANGVQEFWIDGNLEASKTGMNLVGTYTAYGINAIFFENYWNSGAPRQQERYFDNIVISTQRIGCLGSDTTPPVKPAGLRIP